MEPPADAKEYGLKTSEAQVINQFNAMANQMMGVFISFIAIERLSLQVTENTAFRVENGKLFVWENPPQDEQPSVATADDNQTGKVLKDTRKK